ncbi:MAG TPA: thiamine phosphate synthase [Syntrophomonas sp.]|nr:thiamine phosphate synthase [Syntrophomonas sp.]
MRSDVDYTLYLVTDRELMSTETLEEAVRQAISGGCTIIQLREKSASSLEFYQTALRIREITMAQHVPLIINDRVDIAIAADADGVHIGQGDLPAHIVRRLIGGGKLIGVSVSTAEEAVKAAEDGADYIGVGAMYPTGTKSDARLVTMEELKRIRNAVSIPIVVIGGINKKTVPDFAGTGIDGLAVVSAVISQEDIAGASRELVKQFRSGRHA